MRILPVIDLMQGQVVRGIAGRRHEYKPIVSKLTDSTAPSEIARAFRKHFSFNEIYVADLDAIAGQPPALATYAALRADGFRLWVDAGIRDANGAGSLLGYGVETVIAGLETLAGPEALPPLLERVTPARLVFSLDLKNGQPLSAAGWRNSEPFAIAAEAVALGVQRILVLDLAKVGIGAGVGTENLCRRLRVRFQDLEIAAGGGVRHEADLQAMEKAGMDWLLVASALHDQRITAACGLANPHVQFR